MQEATIASHRFGYSESSLRTVQADPRGWVLQQFQTPAAMDTTGLIDSPAALALTRDVLKAAQQAKPPETGKLGQDDLGPMGFVVPDDKDGLALPACSCVRAVFNGASWHSR